MRYFFFLVSAFSSISIFAQNSSGGTGIIKGEITDSLSKNPVEFAAVALWKGNKAIDGTLTLQNGKFKFDGVGTGVYKIIISFVGYLPKSIENISIDSKGQVLDLPIIRLVSDNIKLNEVVVTGQATLIEDHIDKMVYNADKDISNRGATAEEVLRKVPMLSVDLDGNVELRGSQNVKVLINNKPSTIFAASIADAIKQIPSDQIKSVEVITSPGAKYDGEGTAGIINIILKKNTLSGVTGNISTGVGYLGSFANGSLNLRDRKWGMSLNGGGRYSYNFKTVGENLRKSVINDRVSYLEQFDENKSLWNYGRYQASFDYDFDSKTNLTISYAGRNRGNGGKGTQITRLLDGERILLNENNRYIDQISKGLSSDLDFTFNKKYSNPVQELSVMAQYSNSNRNDDYTAIQDGLQADSSRNNGLDREINLQLDYVQPLGDKVKWELGGKGSIRKATSDGKFYSFDQSQEAYFLNSLRSNFLDYDQQVWAGYSSFTLKLPKNWGLQAGVRYESTAIEATFKELANPDIPGYSNWLPSISLNRKFKEGGSIKASYSQRLQRPSIRYLNPYVNYSSNNNISYGSPTLRPELVDLAEISYNAFFDKNSITISLFTRMEDNSITSIKRVISQNEQDITETTYANIGVSKRYGVNFSYNLNPNKNWRLGGGFNTDYTYIDNNTVSNEGWNFSLNLNTSYSLPKDWAVSFFGFMRSRRIELQGTDNGFYFHGITVKKDINKKRGSFGLGLENPFVKSIRFESAYSDLSNPASYFTQSNIRNMYRRSIRIDFQYRFGKLENDKGGLFKKNRRGGSDDSSGGEEMM